jgi:membrane fusion protein (multidrug efflux system)
MRCSHKRRPEANLAYVRDQVNAQIEQGKGAVEQASAGVASASDTANAARRQISVARAASNAASQQLAAAQAAVPAARADANKANADLQRAVSLASTGDISQAQLDAAKAEQAGAAASLQQAMANERAAVASLEESNAKFAGQLPTSNSATQQVSVQQGTLTTAQGKLAEAGSPNRVIAQQAQVSAAEAQAATASAQLKTAQDQYSYTEIHSPIDGFVGAKNVDVGTTVSAGQSLLVIVPLHRVYVTANFKETQLGKMQVGQPAEISIDAYKGVTFNGRVDAIAPASQNTFSLVPAQNATGNFVKVTQRVPVRILFDNPDPKYALRAGMSVEASVKVK